MLKERKLEEVEFHNKRERDRLTLREDEYFEKYSNHKFYSITRKSATFVHKWMSKNCSGKIALDYCCGLGQNSLELAKNGAFVYGIDISNESVKTAALNASKSGYSNKVNFQVMDAECLKFDDSFFDVILCSGVLHHLDLKKALPELARVLKPTGKIICVEALGYNPVMNWYRKSTLHLRTSWEVGHILTLREVRYARRYFDSIDLRFFHLFSILAVPFRNTVFFNPFLSVLEWIDAMVLHIPLIRCLAWQMIFTLQEPKV